MQVLNPSSSGTSSIICVVGARPNFMKIAPIMAALNALKPHLKVTLLHTGQHYDVAMNEQYFDALGIPSPDINLEVGSGSHAVQTAEVMCRPPFWLSVMSTQLLHVPWSPVKKGFL